MRNINKNVANALSQTFFASNYVDLATHRYAIIRGTDYSRKMLEDCDTIEKAFDAFIETLVRPEFQEKMRKFCDSQTIGERVRGNSRIDCEYLSKVVSGWCRASFIPAEWDEDGNVTHVIFAICDVDTEKAHEIEESINNKKTLEDIFNNVPSGIILYEWDGRNLHILRMSKYYNDLYGYSLVNSTGSPDFGRVHPDDVDDYRRAIAHALAETHVLEYVFRVWNKIQQNYVWAQINAIAQSQHDGTSLIYAVYTDVTAQKLAEQRLRKSRASVIATLGAADQFSYEYDPQEHTSTNIMDDDSRYDLDAVIRNYPECFRDSDFIHPEDVELFIETVKEIDAGAESAHCNIRVKSEDKYRHHSCTFETIYDSEKEHNVALLTVVDITPQVMAMQSYENRMQMFMKANEGALCMCSVNLTKNAFANMQASAFIKECGDRAESFDELMELAAEKLPDSEENKEYKKLFNSANLLKRYENQESRVSFEHRYRIANGHTAWVETVVEMVLEPVSGDIVGVCYAKSLDEKKVGGILLNAVLKNDYPMAAIIYADTGEFYLYTRSGGNVCAHKSDYWETAEMHIKESVKEENFSQIYSRLNKEFVLEQLENSEEYFYAFYTDYKGERIRLKVDFRYVDRKHGLLLLTVRDITDTALYEQYKYDGEHDALTGLYNRKTAFRESRRILEQQPDEQFVMLHCDIRQFNLYNSFYGDEMGDRLLCRMAEIIKNMGMHYDNWVYGRIEADVFYALIPADRVDFEKHVRQFHDEIVSYSDRFPLEPVVGAYWVTDKSMTIEAMFNRATIAAKSQKRNLFGIVSEYDKEMDRNLKELQQIIGGMNEAIEKEQFEIYMQPKYSLRSRKMVGAEALVRWNHPEWGMISPGKFVPAFEQNGFIVELDRYVWEHVCRILHDWKASGKPMFPVSVNVSRVSLYSRKTIPFIKEIVTKYGIEPRYLELELTETAYMDEPEELKQMLKELQSYGFKILMDDFGSGYSSLNTLRELPVDVLKLDMKFIIEAQNDSRGKVVLSSVVRMGKLLNLPVVAEGVEEERQAEYLCSIGCEYAQGFLFAGPMPLGDYEKLLEDCSEETENETYINDFGKSTSVKITVDDPLVSIGELEYADGQFAYLKTNRKFISEFDLIDNLEPVSKVFSQHLDRESYTALQQAFEYCAETEERAIFKICWHGNNGDVRKYIGRVYCNGHVGNYADLSVVFLNVTEVNTFGFDV